MPNLEFCAVGDDQAAVLDAVFRLGAFRVFEASSEPDSELREFGAPSEVPDDPHGPYLMLYVVGSGPEPSAKRIDLRPGALGNATFRYECQGWALITLHFGNLFEGRDLRWCHTNHNSETRARKWSEVFPDAGDPARWDWSKVTSASGKLNRAIRAMAVNKVGAHPVLLHAAQLITQSGLQYEYGAGIHPTPSFGTSGDRREGSADGAALSESRNGGEGEAS